jgi:hypothetical protein
MTPSVLHLYVCPKTVPRRFFDVLLDVSDNMDFLRHFLWEATAMEVELWLF